MSQVHKKPGQVRLRLTPEDGGAFTRWRLTGSTVTAVPHQELRQLFRMLSFWSGWPVELVLPAEAGTAEWLEWWSAAIDATHVDHLWVRFDVRDRWR